MKARHVNPAVYAGLMANAAWMVPSYAHALSVGGYEIDNEALAQALGPYAAGLGTGIALAGTVSAIAWHHGKRSQERRNAQEEEEQFRGARHLCAPGEAPHGLTTHDEPDDAIDDEPTSRLASPVADHPVPVTTEADAAPVASAPQPTPAPAPQAEAAPRVTHLPDAGVSPDETTVFLNAAAQKSAQAKPRAERGSASGAHAATDYGDIATNYVQRLTWAQRMSERARGVREVLSERLGGDQMEDMPVIKRADGTVGDVGTAWWQKAVGPEISGALPIQVDDDYSVVQPQVDDLPFLAGRTPGMQLSGVPAVSTRDGSPDARPASVQSPAGRPASAGDAEREDLWEAALAALEEQDTMEQAEEDSAFQDVIGGVETLDDPDDLDDPTAFIPFRTPAGHPEVVDTQSYVDYLVDDELSKNPSQAVRENSREYLHVIQGGSQTMRPVTSGSRQAAKPGKKRGGRHFATKGEAQEA